MALHLMGAGSQGRERASDQRKRIISYVCFGGSRFTRLRDAYLEPWGRDLGDAFALAVRVGSVARSIAYLRQRAALRPEERPLFDSDFTVVLRRAVALTLG
jgi:hypothetical protein